MGTWNIKHSDGTNLTDSNGKVIKVHSLEYNGTWMGECYVTINMINEAPISFSIGDYIEYRGERFEINYDPGKIKAARKNSYGSAFRYENVKFNSLSDELVRSDFLDLVLNDNQLHYTALPVFSFYVDTIDDLLDRIQANLDELYGKAAWKLYSPNLQRSLQRGCIQSEWSNVYSESGNIAIDSTSVTINKQNCWEGLALVNSQFDLNFITRNRNVYVGTSGVTTSKIFMYGKGNGLYEIEQNSESDQKIITRLRAYGSDKNLPDHYYADLGSVPFLYVTGDYKGSSTDNGLSVLLEDSYYDGVFTNIIYDNESNIKHCKIKGRIDGYLFDGTLEIVKKDVISCSVRLLVEEKATSDAIKAKIDAGVKKIEFLDGARASKFDSNRIDKIQNLPNNMACDRLMLPGFPHQSLREWWNNLDDAKKKYFNPDNRNYKFSDDPYRPYIESPNVSKVGVRPSSEYFDTDNKKEGLYDIFPTIEEMMVNNVRIDTIQSGTSITDDGRFAENTSVPDTAVYLSSKINFDLNGLRDNDFAINMKDGMCGGRTFEVSGCVKEDDGRWKLTIKRKKDDAIGLWFPYKDFQINSGDHFVLTGLEMPKEYIDYASEKLLYYALRLLDNNDHTRYVISPKVDNIFMARQNDEAEADTTGEKKSLYKTLKEGDLMLIEDTDLGLADRITIDQLTIKENDGKIPEYEITLRDEKDVTIIQKIQNQIAAISSTNKVIHTISSGASGSTSGSGSLGGGGGALEMDLKTTTTVGYITSGTLLKKGTKFEDIFRMMLYKAAGAEFTGSINETDVEVGTPKTRIVYTAIQNESGPLKSVLFNIEGFDVTKNYAELFTGSGGKLSYTAELKTEESPNWVSSIYTYTATAKFAESSDGSIAEKEIKTTNTVKTYRRWFAGAVAKNWKPESSDDIRALGSGLLTGNEFSFNVAEGWVWLAIAIPLSKAVNYLEFSINSKGSDLSQSDPFVTGNNIDVKDASGNNPISYRVYLYKTEANNNKESVIVRVQ